MQKKIIALIIVMCTLVSMCTIMVSAKENYTTIAEGIYNGHTYKLFGEKILWEEAKEYCEKMGGHLATITSQEENDYIASLIPEDTAYIIGMHRDITGYEKWVTGEEISYSNWAVGQPDNRYGTQSNLILCNKPSWYTKSENCWDDGDDYIHGFICEWDYVLSSSDSNVSVKEKYFPTEEKTYNGHTYQVFDESITWHEAKEKCEKMGGHLVIINSEKENDFITELIQDYEKNLYWIGCYLNKNVWCWVDGSELTYKNWSVNEPNDFYRNDEEAYGHIFRYDYEEYDANGDDHNKGEWNDLAASGDIKGYALNKIGFICEWDNVFSSFGSEISEWASDEIEEAYDKEIIPEILVGEDLTQPITRAEFAAVSVKAYELMANTKALPAVNNPFTDTKDIEVLKAYNTGITTGISATQFDPNALLNREQAATMLTRVFKRATMKGWTIETDAQFKLDYKKPATFADDVKISEWAKDSVYFMAANEIINGVGDNKFAPQNTTTEEEATRYANATREQALIIATRMVENLK